MYPAETKTKTKTELEFTNTDFQIKSHHVTTCTAQPSHSNPTASAPHGPKGDEHDEDGHLDGDAEV